MLFAVLSLGVAVLRFSRLALRLIFGHSRFVPLRTTEVCSGNGVRLEIEEGATRSISGKWHTESYKVVLVLAKPLAQPFRCLQTKVKINRKSAVQRSGYARLFLMLSVLMK